MIRRRLGAVVGMFVLVAVPLLATVLHPASKAAALATIPSGPDSSYSLTAERLDAAHIQVIGTGTTVQNGTTLDVTSASGIYYDRTATDSDFSYKLGGDKKTGVPKGCTQSKVTLAYGADLTEQVNYDVYLSQIGANSANCVELKLNNQFLADSSIGFDLNVGANVGKWPAVDGLVQSSPPQPTTYNFVTFFLQDSTTIYASDGDPAFDSDTGGNNNYLYKQAPNGNFERQSGGTGGHGCSDLITITTPGATVDQANYTTRRQNSDGSCRNDQTIQIALLSSSPQSQASPSAGGGTTSGANGNNGGANECGITNELAWVACPILTGLNWLTSELDSIIGNLLTIDTGRVFDTSGQYYTAWSNIRNLAMGLIVVAAIIAIGGEAIGIELISAYSLRKLAPRILVAIIFMIFAWPVLELVVTFFNDMGNWVGDIMTSPFSGLQDFSYSSNVSKAIGLIPGVGIGAIAGIGAFWGVGGVGGLLSLLGTVALALLIGFITILLRNAIVIAALVASPIWVVAYILPGTRKAATFGKDTFLTALAMFPIVEGFVSIGKVMAHLAEASNDNGFLKAGEVAIFYSIFYLLMPLAFRMGGGLVSNLTGMINDRGRGGFDRLRGIRENGRARMHQERMNDSNDPHGLGRLNGAYRRIAMAGQGGLSVTSRGRNRYRSAQQRLRNAHTGEMVENDAGRAGGDDDATAVASREGMTARRFIQEYQRAGRGHTEAEARNALAQMETNFDARMGSNAMMVAAWKARAASVTGYAGTDAGLAELVSDARRMRASGLITTTDAASAIKANKARGDQGSIGMGELLTQIGRDGAVTGDQIASMRASAREGMLPGALASQRHETISAMSPTIYNELDSSLQTIQAAAPGSQERADAVRTFKQQMASVAGLYQTMEQVSPQNAKLLADGVMARTLDVSGIPELAPFGATNNVTGQMTVQSVIDGGTRVDANGNTVDVAGLRGDSHFREMRREFAATSAAQANAIAQAGGNNGGPPPVNPIPGIR